MPSTRDMMCRCCALMLLLVACEVSCVIWRNEKSQEQVEPREMDVDEALSASLPADMAAEGMKRFRRQSTSDSGIGFTQRLSHDTHRHGLVHWTGFPSEYIFVLTRSQSRGLSTESWLWRSTDYGHTFINDTAKWAADTIIQYYYIAPLSEYLIFADVIHQTLWITRDEGESYTEHHIPFSPDRIIFQSRQAPGSNSTTLAQYVLGYDTATSALWVSTDVGANWHKLSENVTRFNWRVLDSGLESSTAIYFEKAINATHSQLYVSTFPYNSNQLFDELPFQLDSFVLSDEYMFVQRNSNVAVQYSSPLWVSRNRGPFRQARFPLQSQERHYAVVDTSEGEVFIAVYHDINNTNLYLSEMEGLNYSLSLRYVVSPPEDEWIGGYPAFDVHVVEGIVGTFVANTRDPSASFGSTVISYDKGGEWVRLIAPAFDKDNNFIDCQQPGCSLHLQIQASRENGYQSILTQDSAIGLIMAQGNIGNSLSGSRSGSQSNLYFSRDGGFTWFEVESGYWQFQFAAQGAIVAAIPKFRRTSTIRWSCNEGGSFQNVSILTGSDLRNIYVIGMLTEPGERALHITVFGYSFPFTEWLVIDLNFTSVIPNQCTQQDFFEWVPTDERPGSRCLLGESVTYERRRASACCYAEQFYERVIRRSVCNCTQEDFECDFGFERIHLNSPCSPLPDFQWPPLQPSPCPDDSTYNISSGYRKVAGDVCVPGEELSFFPIERPCIVAPPKCYALQSGSTFVMAGTSSTFIFIQIEGEKSSTVYSWNFNDSAVVNVTGYDAAQTQVHIYTRPGVYMVSITASNSGGTCSLTLPVTAIDPLASVTIIPPSQMTSDNEVPVGVQLLFGSRVSTQYGTNYTGGLHYIWVLEDGVTAETAVVATHTFASPATYTVTLTVLYAGTAAVSTSTGSINALDRVSNLYMQAPPVLVAGRELEFRSRYDTQFGTGDVGPVTFTWDFGDGNVNITRMSSTSHTFSFPGNFSISLMASNPFSNQTVAMDVYLLDGVVGVSIVPPLQLKESKVPASLQLVFSAFISTQYNTSKTGSLTFSWDFGDGSATSAGSIASHAYSINGTFVVTCSVQQYGQESTASLSLKVFEASSLVEIRSESFVAGVFVMSGQEVALSVVSIDGSGHIIPPQTHFSWHIFHQGEVPCEDPVSVETTVPQYSLNISCPGMLDISIIGNHSAGSFATQLHITAEDPIIDVAVDALAVVRSGAVRSLTLTSLTRGGEAYQGPISLTISSSNGTVLASSNAETEGSDSLTVQLSRDEASNPKKVIVLSASNDVSNKSSNMTVTLAVRGDYGELRFLFAVSSLPRNFNSSSWQDQMLSALLSYIKNTYLPLLPSTDLEVEDTGVWLNTSDSLARRSTPEQFLYADMNLLPASLQPLDIQAVIDVSTKIQQDGSSGNFKFTVAGQELKPSTVELRNSNTPVVVVEPVNLKLYIGLGVGLGLGLLLVVGIAITLATVLYSYRRSYKRLNVRYARLRQTPVRFTFTQGGEMVEDEDYEEEEEEEEEEEDQVGRHNTGGDNGVKLNIM